jgi:hypothetical protein
MRTIVLSVLILLVCIGCNHNSSQSNSDTTQTKMNDTHMKNEDYTTSIVVDQDPASVFKAIQNFRGWWSEEIVGPTDQLNETFFYHYQDVHLCKIKLIETIANQKLVYQVVENEFNFTKDKSEWVGTILLFDIFTEGGKTKMVFTHIGLVPTYECYEVCNDAWTSYIQGSLKNLITTGVGKPNAAEGGLNAELVEKWGLPNTGSSSKQGKDYATSILLDQSPAEVFAAINNVRGWWQGEVKGYTTKLNDEFTYQMGAVHFSKQKIVELVPNKKVVWLVTQSNLSFTAKKDEWTHTRIQFDISSVGGKTKLSFTHRGLVPSFECYEGCSGAWEQLIGRSLFSFITTGKGVDVF